MPYTIRKRRNGNERHFTCKHLNIESRLGSDFYDNILKKSLALISSCLAGSFIVATIKENESQRNQFYLLQKGDELTSSPLVRFWQVKVLQVQHQSLAVLWSVHSASVRTDYHTGLLQLLKNVHGRGLSTTVYHSYLG